MEDKIYYEFIIPLLSWEILSCILIISFIIISFKNYFAQSLFIQLKVEFLISCLIHQTSMVPFFILDNPGSNAFLFFCNFTVFLNLTSTYSVFLLGLAIPFMVYLLMKSSEKIEKNKTKYHFGISFIIWGLSITISFIMTWYGENDIENDTICWFTTGFPEYLFSAIGLPNG